MENLLDRHPPIQMSGADHTKSSALMLMLLSTLGKAFGDVIFLRILAYRPIVFLFHI